MTTNAARRFAVIILTALQVTFPPVAEAIPTRRDPARSTSTEDGPTLPLESSQLRTGLFRSRLARGVLDTHQFQAFMDHLAKHQLLPAIPLGIVSAVWTDLRARHHWQDVLSLHQTNFLGGVSYILIADWMWRQERRDESSAPTLALMTVFAGLNVICETSLLGQRSDPADLASGMLGVLAAYLIYRTNEYTFTRKLRPRRPGPTKSIDTDGSSPVP